MNGSRHEFFICVKEDAYFINPNKPWSKDLGEYALVHCETLSGNQFILKTTDLDKISKGILSGFYVDVDDTYSFDSAS